MTDCRCDENEWSAWHDRMPGKVPTLYVEGSCVCPTPGYTLELRRKEPQGVNPKDLLLELIETPPSGPEPEILTETPVRYEEPTEFDYDTVSIVPGGPTSIPVKDVS